MATPVFPGAPGSLIQSPVPNPYAPPVAPVADFDPADLTVEPSAPVADFDLADVQPVADFDPADVSVDIGVYTPEQIKALPDAEIAKLKDFTPELFGAQNLDAIAKDPELLDKVVRLYRERSTQGTTLKEKAKAVFSGIPEVAKALFSGAGALAVAAKAPQDAAIRALRGEDLTKVGSDLAARTIEVPASVETAVTGSSDLVRRSAREIKEGAGKILPGVSSKAELTDAEWRQRFFDDAAFAKQAEEAAKGNAAVMEAFGADAATLAEHGITLNPEQIQALSVVTDPINYIPVGATVGAVTKIGGKLARVAIAKTGTTAQAVRLAKTLNNATELAAKAVPTAGAVVEKAGNALTALGTTAEKGVRAVGGTASGLGLGGILGHDVYSALGGALVAKAGPRLAQGAGRAVARAGGAIASPLGKATLNGAVGGFVKGVAEGAALTLPFEIGARPDEEKFLLGAAGLGGATRGALEGAAPGAKVAGAAAQNKLAETIFKRVEQIDRESAPYGDFPELDAMNATESAKRSPQERALLNATRELFRDVGNGEVQAYVVTPQEFRARTGREALGYALTSGERTLPDGTSRPTIQLLLNSSTDALPHELFHALETLDAEGANALRAEVSKNLTQEQLAAFEQQYNSRINGGRPESAWTYRLPKDKILNEIAAESFSRLLLSQDLSGVAPGVVQKAALFASSILESLGAPLGGVGKSRREAGVSNLGVRPGAETTKKGRAWLGDLLSRLNDEGTLGEPYLKMGTTDFDAPYKPVEAPANPAATIPPTPPVTPAPAPVAPTVTPANPPSPTPAPLAPEARNIRTTRAAQDDFSGRRAGVKNTAPALDAARKTGDAATIAAVEGLSPAVESGGVVEIIHSGVKTDGYAEGRSTRRAAQEEAYIQENLKNAPQEIRDAYQKVFTPVRWEVVGGKPQLLAMSLDKVLANAHKAASDAAFKGVGDLIPYEVVEGKLTDNAWGQFVDDLQTYAENQQNGFRGDGQKLERPAGDVGLSIPPENPNFTPRPLTEERMNFLNLVQGLNPPLTARVGKQSSAVVPGNVKGQILAEVNRRTPEKPAVIRPQDIQKQSFADGRSIMETNPLRNALAKEGVPVRELIEVTERINAKDIQSFRERPELNFKAPVTDTIRGGFLPEDGRVEGQFLPADIDVEKAKNDPNIFWHGSPSGDLRGAANGLHLGTYEAAKQALEARIGKPVEGTWDGTREYGKTLLKGREALKEGEYQTGYSVGREKNALPDGTAKYSDGTPVPLDAKPVISPFKIAGPMTNGRYNAVGDTFANARMSGQIKKGQAVRGYYYKNEGEDVGSISAVVPRREHLTDSFLPEDYTDRVLRMTPEEFYKEARSEGAMNNKTDRLGLELTDKADLDRLVQARDSAQSLYEAAAAAGDFDQMQASALKRQFFREIYEAATNTGSAKGRVNGTAPFDESKGTGLAFKDFFSSVTKGEFGKSNVPFEPVLNVEAQAPFIAELAKHSGNFDEHISKSIPTFKETQVRVGDALLKTYPEGARVLDVGASEGSLMKTVSALSEGKIETVSLDPNPDMAKFFREKSEVPGATFEEKAFREGFTGVEAFDSADKFDVVHETMVFQFISPERQAQFAEAKRLMKPDGVLLVEEKVKNPKWAENETKKDREYKDRYFSKAELAAKDKVVGFQQAKTETKAVGMVDNMVQQADLEGLLGGQFEHVVQYWDSGNFKGYAASDSRPMLDKLVGNMGDLKSDFSTVETPRRIEGGQFLPQTEAGKKLVEDGYELRPDRLFDTGVAMRLFDDGKEVGVVSAHLFDPKTAEISLAEIDKEHRGGGVGEALYRELLTELRNRGVTKVSGSMISGSPLAIRKKIFGKVEDLKARDVTSTDLSAMKSVDVETALKNFKKADERGGGYNAKGYNTITPDMQFLPADIKRKAPKFEYPPEEDISKADFSKYVTKKTTKKADGTRTVKMAAWITPDGAVENLSAAWHEQELANRAEEWNKKFGTDFSKEVDQTERLKALNDGFVRVRYTPNNGQMMIEVAAAKWTPEMERRVRDVVTANADKTDALGVSLVGPRGELVDSNFERVVKAPNKEAALNDIINGVRATDVAPGRGPSLIQRARAMGGDFLPGTPEFNKWAGEAEVFTSDDDLRDYDGGKPLVIEGYHGTTHEFNVFDPTQTNPENDMGRGIYISTSPEDVSVNYAGLGPDLTSRIERRAEQLQSQDDSLTFKRAKNLAKKELTEHQGATMKVFVKLEKPLKLGKGEPYWDYSFDESSEVESGPAVEFRKALQEAASNFDFADMSELELPVEGRASEFLKAAKEFESFQYADDSEGNLVGNEIIRQAIERMGYDGIIDTTVSKKFPNMKGMDNSTAHIIAFKPEQVKSATGNRGTFDPSNPNINFLPGGVSRATFTATPNDIRSRRVVLPVPKTKDDQ